MCKINPKVQNFHSRLPPALITTETLLRFPINNHNKIFKAQLGIKPNLSTLIKKFFSKIKKKWIISFPNSTHQITIIKI